MPSSRERLRTALARGRRIGRREIGAFFRWLEDTQNFVHLSSLLFIPLLIGLVTFISNTVDLLPFLLFPPLASGTYTLFANPESRYASPRRFVGGMTVGAICGWIAIVVTARYWYHVRPEAFQVYPGAAALGILLTGVVTWATDLEEAQAFSTALLVLVVGVTQLIYVVSVFLSSLLVASVFVVWRDTVYEQRADYLYRTTSGDDNVLVPMRGETAETVAFFGAHLASSHETGRMVLYGVVPPEEGQAGETVVGTDADTRPASGADSADPEAIPDPARETVDRLEAHASRIQRRFDVPCEVLVVTGDPDDAEAVLRGAEETSCDLIVAPYEAEDGRLSRFVRGLFTSRTDVVAVRTDGSRETWRHILVPVRRQGDVAHAMLDFADRLAGERGWAAVCRCVRGEPRRRDAETMVADLAETFDRAFETRVATVPITDFLAANAPDYDLTIVGSSTDRTLVSRFIDPPTFQQLDDLDCDVAVVHRG